VAAGTGYTAGDLVTLDGGDGLARASILTVDVDGVVLTISLVGTGSGYSMSTYDAVGGSGSGLTISVGPKPFPCRVDEIERFITEQLGPSVVQAVSRYELSFEWDAPVKPTSRIKIASSGNPELVGVSFDVMEAAQQTTEVLHSAICTLTQATSANP